MNQIWRMIWTLLFSRFESKTALFEESVAHFRVLPTDIDILMHVNNGRYFSFMDLARTNHMIRCGVFQKSKQADLYPVVASEMIRFKRSLLLFQRFDIHTQVIYWDERFFYIAHRVMVKDKLYALALIKACMLKKNVGPQTSKEVLSAIGEVRDAPEKPHFIHEWQQSEDHFYNDML